MNEDYLWDRTGQVDLGMAGLEKKLAPLGWKAKQRNNREPRLPLRKAAMVAAAVAAAVVAVVTIPQPAVTSEWQIDGRATRVGEVVRPASNLKLEAAEIGTVDVAPGSELRIGAKRGLELRQGRLHAFIWAPPSDFTVETRSAKAVDLGCEYTISVNEHGDGELSVETGWVAFVAGDRESFIPAGASCRTSALNGPGLPYFDDASPSFKAAAVRKDLNGLLRDARSRDAMTLWHAMRRTSGSDRSRVIAGYKRLIPDAATISEQALLRGDKEAFDASWNSLHLENADWWRQWKRRW